MRTLIVALVASTISATASASELRYTYTGNDFTNVDVNGPSTPFTTSDFISFTFTSPDALGPNLSDAGFGGPITSWSLTLGPLSYSSLDPTSVLYSINFSTDAAGHITAWQFTTQTDVVAPNLQPAEYPPTPYEEEVASFNLPPTFGVADLIYIPSIYEDSYYAYNGGSPGTWTVTSVPEPSTWAMMLAGFWALGLAACSARRRRITAKDGAMKSERRMVAKGRRAPALLGRLVALASGVGLAAIGTAHALTVPLATFDASLEVFGYGGGGSTPGPYNIDNYCDAFGCGSASATMTSNVAGEQTTSGSALSSRDVGANSSIDIVYYFYFPGPAGGMVDYHWSASGSTSLFGGGAAFANLYKNSVPQGNACSTSVVGNCGSVSDAFNFNIELSAPANTLQVVEIQLSGSTAGFGGGPYSATIDPLITVDPSSAAEGYSLELSPNVTQDSVAPSAPEPSTWAMLLTGFAALGFAYRVRRRAAIAYPRG